MSPNIKDQDSMTYLYIQISFMKRVFGGGKYEGKLWKKALDRKSPKSIKQ